MSMRLGMNMFLWTTHVTAEHFPVFEQLKACGYEGVEIVTVRGDLAHYKTVRRALDDCGLDCSTLTLLAADQDPLSDDAAVRQRGLDHIDWAVEVAQELGSGIICGPMHSAHAVFSGAGPTESQLDRSADFLRQAGAIAARGSVVLALEYLNRFESYLVNTAAATDALVRRTDHPAIRTAYDTHHGHIEEASAGDAIRACVETLVHVQLSESHRGVPGTGQVDWQGTLSALHAANYDGWLMVESFSRADPEFAKAVCIWRDFAASEEEVYRGAYEFLAPQLTALGH